jgi:thiol-disulfide isomerase/thioredoxin
VQSSPYNSLKLELLGTLGCHLCDLAEELVQKTAYPLGASFIKIDIADNDQLVEEFGVKIPVIRAVADKDQILSWPFDQQQLIHWIQAL